MGRGVVKIPQNPLNVVYERPLYVTMHFQILQKLINFQNVTFHYFTRVKTCQRI